MTQAAVKAGSFLGIKLETSLRACLLKPVRLYLALMLVDSSVTILAPSYSTLKSVSGKKRSIFLHAHCLSRILICPQLLDETLSSRFIVRKSRFLMPCL